MRLMIVDDEPPARERLARLVAELAGHDVVAEAGDGREALERLDAAAADALLLDIRMPGMDGLEVARHLAGLEQAPAVIFTTAYDEFALAAFDAGAVAYLLKPVRREKLEAALAAAQRVSRAQLAALEAGRGPARAARRHICARVRGELRLVPIEEIAYFRADQKYVTVRHAGGELLIEESLKHLEDEFGSRLMRIHRNALVAIEHIEALERDDEGQARLKLKRIPETLEVSRRLLAEVKERLKQG
jgi:two-component system response regulator AlgR